MVTPIAEIAPIPFIHKLTHTNMAEEKIDITIEYEKYKKYKQYFSEEQIAVLDMYEKLVLSRVGLAYHKTMKLLSIIENLYNTI